MMHEGLPSTVPVHPHSRPRNWFKAFFCGTAILCCGIVIGSATTFRYLHNREFEMPFSPQRMVERIVNRLGRGLDLTTEQRKAIQDAFLKSNQNMDAIRIKAEPEITTEVNRLRAQDDTILTPGPQRDTWNARFIEMHERMRPHPPGTEKRDVSTEKDKSQIR